METVAEKVLVSNTTSSMGVVKHVVSLKKLLFSFIAVILIGVMAFAGINYFVDPFFFFRSMEDIDYNWENYYNSGFNVRLRNVCMLQNAPSDTYEGLIVGGSKGLPIVPELMELYTGQKYFSAITATGEFDYYEKIIRYALQHQPINHIVLHLSGVEVYRNPPQNSETYRFPDFVESDTALKDVLYYLFADISYSINDVLEGSAPSLSERFIPQMSDPDEFSAQNSENLDFIYDMGLSDYVQTVETDPLAMEARIHGARTREDYYFYIPTNSAGRDIWIEKRILSYYGVTYEARLEKLFNQNTRIINADSNLMHLQNIVKLCEENDVELTVILGATCLLERADYEGEDYWNYLYRLSQITDFYDFSSFCDINMNLYNFFDPGHNLDFVSCVMIDNIYGNGEIPFGEYVTAENFDSYIARRRQSYYDLEQEYRQTGTVVLPSIGDASDLSSIPGEYWVEMIRKNSEKYN